MLLKKFKEFTLIFNTVGVIPLFWSNFRWKYMVSKVLDTCFEFGIHGT